ncbi:CD82 antigen [Hemicordylus capensis]|uniref:CD82 antigen n=1 Tax=Hemicordylus capensis TaxID=884348 RepID=UPI00230484E9|nr:CD82 antigen [Hemicordylus capensis]XP_053139673.1 CD82 antigen [Hemicordylus capensis]XP_053139674.1 CD82 antigen [Hemicordylus capensis]
MGSGCLKVTKYFLFLFNLLFFILGAVILGFGIWILVDKSSFISVLQNSSHSLKVGAFILIGVGSVTMLMGFLGCIGAVNEIRCLLGLYFTCLLLILLAQIAVGVLIYTQQETLRNEMSDIVVGLIRNYNPNDETNRTIEDAWDYVQLQLSCCGWNGPDDWKNNTILLKSNQTYYPCSCSIESDSSKNGGFCDFSIPVNSTSDVWPVHNQECQTGVKIWVKDNLGVILGVCSGVAFIELLGMVLSICLCKNIHTEDYTKVPKY